MIPNGMSLYKTCKQDGSEARALKNNGKQL
jgi:hypothetical protein